MGERGEGFSGTIKDTWTKPSFGGWKQGREVEITGVGGEWWGINADKCT